MDSTFEYVKVANQLSNIARAPMSSTPLNEATSTGQGLSRLDYLKPAPGLVVPCILRGERPLFVRREAVPAQAKLRGKGEGGCPRELRLPRPARGEPAIGGAHPARLLSPD